MKYSKYITLFFIVLLIAFSVQAMRMGKGDSASCSTMVSRHFGFIAPGAAWLSTDDMNDFLVTQGLSKFTDMSPSFTIGKRKELKRLFFESGFTFRYFDNHTRSNLKMSLSDGTYIWNTGFNLLSQLSPVTLFPYAGMGVGVAALHVRNDSRDFSEAITSNGTDITMWQGAFLLNIGAGADYVLNKETKGMVFGIRGGYIFDPFTNKREWRSNGTTINNLPNLDQSGPYIQLLIGGWGEHKNKRK